MRTVLQRIAAGALAYVISYVLIGVLALPRLGQHLTVDPDSGTTAFEVYQAAGRPLWQAVGWFTLNAHGVPITVHDAVSTANFVNGGTRWLAVIQGWYGLVPMVACLLVGAAVALRGAPSKPIPLSVGAYMVPGYLFAILASIGLFAGPFGPIEASVTLFSTYPPERWLIPSLMIPLVCGSLGALVGQSPVLTSTVEYLWSDSSFR